MEEEDEPEEYKYPGEPKKPNFPPSFFSYGVVYDDSPDFKHEPRPVFPSDSKPKKPKGPYGKFQTEEEPFNEKSKEEVTENWSEEKEAVEEDKSDVKEDFSSFSKSSPDDDFENFQHESIFVTPKPSSSIGEENRNSHSKYPVPYSKWKALNYPKVSSQAPIKSHYKKPSSYSFGNDHKKYSVYTTHRPAYTSGKFYNNNYSKIPNSKYTITKRPYTSYTSTKPYYKPSNYKYSSPYNYNSRPKKSILNESNEPNLFKEYPFIFLN